MLDSRRREEDDVVEWTDVSSFYAVTGLSQSRRCVSWHRPQQRGVNLK